MPKVQTIVVDAVKFHWKSATEIPGSPVHLKICSFRQVRKALKELFCHVRCNRPDLMPKEILLCLIEFCKPWATKIWKTRETFRFIASVLNVVNPKFITHSDPEETDVLPRTKRSLPTSVSTPERSPGQKKISKTSQSLAKTTRKISARKSLGCHFDSNANENVDTLLNINDIISLEPEQSTHVKVLVLWPSGKTDVRVPDRKENINLLKNIALRNWSAVANAVLTHSELRQDILRA